MARTIDQIQKELETTFAPQKNVLNQQIKAIPGMIASQKSGLEAQQQEAFGNILSGAKRRGLKFSGIPLSEQAQYTSTQFLPALTNLQNQGNQQRLTLQGSLADIFASQGALARQLQQTELDRDAQLQAAEAAARASAAAQQSSFGGLASLFGSQQPQAPLAAPTSEQLLQQATNDAGSYAQRVISQYGRGKAAELLMATLDSARKTNSATSMARYNALAKVLGLDANFDLASGKFSPGSARFFNSPGASAPQSQPRSSGFNTGVRAPSAFGSF